MKRLPIFIRYTVFLTGLLLPILASAQSIKDVRINEIQVHNTDGLRDEYGQISGWIELYNKGYGKVNVAGCILKVNGKEYRIPKGDPSTGIPPQGYVVFYAGGTPNKGTFHTNFTLDDTDFVELYDADGKLINRFQFNPADMTENVSYGWFEDHDGKEKLMQLPATTPGGNNNTEEKVSRAELFRQADPSGIVLTLISIIVVTIVLTALFFIFKYMGNFHIKVAEKKAERINREHIGDNHVTGKSGAITNDELAAIAVAIYKYSESLHDEEDLALTISRVSKAYSPWNSKIYSLRQIPNKK